MKKRVNKKSDNRVDYEALEIVRAYTIEQIVKQLNDDACNMSSCQIRMYILDAIGV